MSQDRKYKTKNSQYRPGMATAGQKVNPRLDAERKKSMRGSGPKIGMVGTAKKGRRLDSVLKMKRPEKGA